MNHRIRIAAWAGLVTFSLAIGLAAAAAPLPPDVDPVSRNRLPNPTRADMTSDEERAIYDDLTKGNVPGMRLFSPRLARAFSHAHRYAKYESGMDGRLVEIAVLVTAREINSQFEWTRWEAHGRAAKESSVEPAIIDIIKYCRPLSGAVAGLGPKETVIINLGREMLGPRRKVSSKTFADSVRLFGRRGTVDLVALMALYVATDMEVNAFDAQLPAGMKPSLPPMAQTPACRKS